MTYNDIVVIDLDDDNWRIPDEFLAQSVHDDVLEDERLVPSRTQRLLNDLHNVISVIIITVIPACKASVTHHTAVTSFIRCQLSTCCC